MTTLKNRTQKDYLCPLCNSPETAEENRITKKEGMINVIRPHKVFHCYNCNNRVKIFEPYQFKQHKVFWFTVLLLLVLAYFLFKIASLSTDAPANLAGQQLSGPTPVRVGFEPSQKKNAEVLKFSQAEVDAVQAKLQVDDRKNQALVTSNENFNKANKQHQLTLQALQTKLENSNTLLLDRDSDMTELSSQNQILIDSFKQLESKSKQSLEALASLKKELSQVQTQLRDRDNKIVEFKENTRLLLEQQTHDLKNQALASSSEKLKKTNEHQSTLQALQTKLTSLSALLLNRDSEISTLSSQNKALTGSVKQLESRSDQSLVALDSLKKELGQVQTRLKDRNNEIVKFEIKAKLLLEQQKVITLKKPVKQPDSVIKNHPDVGQNILGFTLQIASVETEDQVKDLVASLRDGQANESQFYYYRSTKQRKTWFPVFYGIFEHTKAARHALKNLPNEWKTHQAIVRNIKDNSMPMKIVE